MDEKSYIKSLHYCPMCGQVVGCGDGHCDSVQFREHVKNCRLRNQGKTGRVRHEPDED
jgi:hypothetical protein